ncbi:metallophosphoesterase [Limibacter armeniacum]|uniref:metallophosphoesterase n=1 Tax=Limibacter armeniacum TaxID=466084 RepID=UPI002FE5071E
MNWFRKMGRKRLEQITKFNYKPAIWVPKPEEGRRFVVGDIHGCSKSFKQLLKRIDLNHNDQLFLLGDLINKGPRSKGVVKHVVKLREKGFQVYCVRGNHEEALINDIIQMNGSLSFRYSHLFKLLDKDKKLKRRYLKFFYSMPYYIELDDFFLVHAGFNLNASTPLRDFESMTTVRNLENKRYLTLDALKSKHVLVGHTPTYMGHIEEAVALQRKVIPLDNGCTLAGKKIYFGNLLCLEIDGWKLYKQPCID